MEQLRPADVQEHVLGERRLALRNDDSRRWTTTRARWTTTCAEERRLRSFYVFFFCSETGLQAEKCSIFGLNIFFETINNSIKVEKWSSFLPAIQLMSWSVAALGLPSYPSPYSSHLRHVSDMYQDMYRTCIKSVSRHVSRHVSKVYRTCIRTCIKTCIGHVSRHVSDMHQRHV